MMPFSKAYSLSFGTESIVGVTEFDENKTWYEVEIEIEEGEGIVQTIPFGFNKVIKFGENSTTVKINTTGGGGTGRIDQNVFTSSWDATHDDTEGFEVVSISIMNIGVKNFAGGEYSIFRGFFPLNKTGTVIESETVTSAKLCVWVTGVDDDDNDGDDFMAVIGNTTQASPSNLVTTDYDQCGAIDDPKEYSNRIDLTAGFTIDEFNCFTINSDGINTINNVAEIIPFGIREGHDILDNPLATSGNVENRLKVSTPTVAGQEPFYNFTFDGADTTNPSFSNQEANTTPKLNGSLRMNITITDTNADSYKFFWNNTGSFVNDSSASYTSGTPVSTTKTELDGNRTCWGYWANDTSGNTATSSTTCFTATTDSCSCPSSGNFEIINGDDCTLSTICDIGTNKFRVLDGSMIILANGFLRAGGCFIADNERFFIDDEGGAFCGS